MSDIKVSMSGIGDFTMSLDLHDPAPSDGLSQVEVWEATFCDPSTGDCDVVYFEMEPDYDAWDLIDEAIQTYRLEI